MGKFNLGAAKTYVECIEKLAAFDYIDPALARAMIAAVGLRNLLIHEYARIDIEKLYGFLALTDDFARFIEAVHRAV